MRSVVSVLCECWECVLRVELFVDLIKIDGVGI